MDPESCAYWLITVKAFEQVRASGIKNLGENVDNLDTELAQLKQAALSLTG